MVNGEIVNGDQMHLRSTAMLMCWYDTEYIAREGDSGPHLKPLYADIGQVFAPYRPGGQQGHI